MITGKNYIGNRLSATGSTFRKTFNPKLNIENEYEFYEATLEEVDEATELAHQAFKEYRNVR